MAPMKVLEEIDELIKKTLNHGVHGMFAVIYKFKLKPAQEELYQHHWNKIANFFIKHRGATGSCLHKGDNGLWVAYSRWPDKKTRDASWPGEKSPNNELPEDIKHSIQIMQTIKKENSELEADYEEICLNVINDLLGMSESF
jgi:hypothetical protein